MALILSTCLRFPFFRCSVVVPPGTSQVSWSSVSLLAGQRASRTPARHRSASAARTQASRVGLQWRAAAAAGSRACLVHCQRTSTCLLTFPTHRAKRDPAARFAAELNSTPQDRSRCRCAHRRSNERARNGTNTETSRPQISWELQICARDYNSRAALEEPDTAADARDRLTPRPARPAGDSARPWVASAGLVWRRVRAKREAEVAAAHRLPVLLALSFAPHGRAAPRPPGATRPQSAKVFRTAAE